MNYLMSAAKAGIEDCVTQLMGRWSSSAFLPYVSIPQEHLGQFTSTLAHTQHS